MTSSTTLAPKRHSTTLTPPRPGPVIAAITGSTVHDAIVLRAARMFASHRDADLALVAVAPPLPAYFSGADALVALPPDDPEQRRAELVAAARAKLSAAFGHVDHVSIDARYGDPAEQITAAARARGASLIVVGIGRHRPMDRLLGGETALRVVRLADRPVLAVAGELDTLPTRVVVGTDFSPSSAYAAQAALPFVDPHASLTFAHVWQRVDMISPAVAAAEATDVDTLRERFRRFADVVDVPDTMAPHVRPLEGRTAEQLLTFAGHSSADLLVVGRQTHSWFDRLFVGSVTTSVLRGATCAVLVTADPEAAERDRLRRLLTGVTEGAHAAEWRAQLDGFGRRNQGRPVTIEEDDPSFGAQTLVSSLPLRGAAYDPHDRRAEVMLGDPGTDGRRLTHSVGDVRTVVVLTDAQDCDTALAIRHGAGQTLLTFRDAAHTSL